MRYILGKSPLDSLGPKAHRSISFIPPTQHGCIYNKTAKAATKTAQILVVPAIELTIELADPALGDLPDAVLLEESVVVLVEFDESTLAAAAL